MDTDDPYQAHDRELRRVHAALLARVAAIVDADALGEAVAHACKPLLWHHRAEDEFLFAGIRRASAGRSSDVAFLERCHREHVELHALCERLLAGATDVAVLARELHARLASHVAEEEAALAPEHLRTMLTPLELGEIARQAEIARLRL